MSLRNEVAEQFGIGKKQLKPSVAFAAVRTLPKQGYLAVAGVEYIGNTLLLSSMWRSNLRSSLGRLIRDGYHGVLFVVNEKNYGTLYGLTYTVSSSQAVNAARGSSCPWVVEVTGGVGRVVSTREYLEN